MSAILKAGGTNYFFGSTIQASKALELLSKATVVERDYQAPGEQYREPMVSELSEYRSELELKIIKQKKPKPAQLALPGE